MCSSTGLGCGGTHPSPELSKARVPSHLGRSHGLCDKDKLRRGLEGHPESTAKKKGRMGQEKRSQANGSSLRPRKMLSGEVGSSKSTRARPGKHSHSVVVTKACFEEREGLIAVCGEGKRGARAVGQNHMSGRFEAAHLSRETRGCVHGKLQKQPIPVTPLYQRRRRTHASGQTELVVLAQRTQISTEGADQSTVDFRIKSPEVVATKS